MGRIRTMYISKIADVRPCPLPRHREDNNMIMQTFKGVARANAKEMNELVVVVYIV